MHCGSGILAPMGAANLKEQTDARPPAQTAGQGTIPSSSYQRRLGSLEFLPNTAHAMSVQVVEELHFSLHNKEMS